MAYKEITEKQINEMELVNNKEGKNGVYKVDVAKIEPVMNKTGTAYEYILFDKDNNRIGMKDSKNKLTIFPKYKALLKEEGIDLKSKKLVLEGADIPKTKGIDEIEKNEMMIKKRELEEARKQQEEQEFQHEQQKKKKDEKIQEPKKPPVKQHKQKDEEERVTSSSSRINRIDLMKDKRFKNVTAWTTITDLQFLDSVQGIKAHSPQIDKNSIVIAEVDNRFRILAKEMGTDRIIDLTPDSRQINNSVEQVNRLDGNKETEGGRSYTFKHPIFDNQEMAIRKTSTGQIEVEQIKDIDGKGNREAIKVGTDVTHPTQKESERAKYEKYGYNFKDEGKDAVMTNDEIEEEIDPLILENATKYKDSQEMDDIKTEILDDISSGENPSYNDLEDIVKTNVEEYEETKEADEPEIGEENKEVEEVEEERTLESDALERINRRRRKNN